jgi:hypothetical protein
MYDMGHPTERDGPLEQRPVLRGCLQLGGQPAVTRAVAAATSTVATSPAQACIDDRLGELAPARLGCSQRGEANRVGSWTWLIARCWWPSWIQRAPQLVQMAVG